MEPIDPSRLSAAAQRVLSAEAPGPVRLMAARGVIPGVRPADLLAVMVVLAGSDDAGVSAAANAALERLPPPLLAGALGSDLEPAVIDRLAAVHASDPDHAAALLRMPRIADDTLVALAEQADERLGELIATNEDRLLRSPRVIEKLYMNRRVRMSTADRLLELAVRNDLELDIPTYREAAAAIRDELIVEQSEEPTFDDVLFAETTVLADALGSHPDEDTHDEDEDGNEHVRDKFLPLHARLAQMTVSQKVRAATLGTAAERYLLVRDPNRLIAAAAVKSPLMRPDEAARISASRAVPEEVLRTIAMNREFTRDYQVKLNLVSNPRTPLTFASRLVPLLRENDLRSLSKSKNVPGAIQTAVRQQLERKQKRG
ncbi:MAG: hypothetical protein IT376_17450 [Polyangiaceae bacterium]|nr:hypothetical protein [Polyangiaceae bacterium]